MTRLDPKTEDFEETMAWQMKAAGLPEPQRQFLFVAEIAKAGAPTYPKSANGKPRRWQADFCWWPKYQVILEVDGGGYGREGLGGRHTTGKGYEDDRERDAEAMLLGFRVLRVTPKHVKNGKALHWVEMLLRSA